MKVIDNPCYVCIHVCTYVRMQLINYIYIHFVVLYIDPPAITAIEVTKVCANDFTVSWTAASNEEGLSYSVTLLPTSGGGAVVDTLMDTSYNFTDLMPNTAYDVIVASRLTGKCSGINNTKMVTTLTVEAGVPQGELNVVIIYLHFTLQVQKPDVSMHTIYMYILRIFMVTL